MRRDIPFDRASISLVIDGRITSENVIKPDARASSTIIQKEPCGKLEIPRGWLGRTQRSEAAGSYAIVKSIEFRHSPIHRAPSVFSERPAAGYAPLARRGTSENTERFTCH